MTSGRMSEFNVGGGGYVMDVAKLGEALAGQASTISPLLDRGAEVGRSSPSVIQ